MSICANCEKAKVYVDRNAKGERSHYVKCLHQHWSRRISLLYPLLRAERNCPDYVSMGDEGIEDFLATLPTDRVEYEETWNK